jgi:hypothetical protein
MRPILTPITVFLVIMMSMDVNAQFGTVVVFSPTGEEFFLSLGGKMQNQEAASRVEGDNPGGPTFKIRVSFKDPAIKEVSKTIFNKPASRLYYKLDRNKKGEFVIESSSGDESAIDNKKGGETSPKNCDTPMNDVEFAIALDGVTSPPFEPARLSVAKKNAEKSCMNVSQIKQIIEVFKMDGTRLSFAKFAYDHTYDKSQYEEIRTLMKSDKSKEEFDNFLAGKK